MGFQFLLLTCKKNGTGPRYEIVPKLSQFGPCSSPKWSFSSPRWVLPSQTKKRTWVVELRNQRRFSCKCPPYFETLGCVSYFHSKRALLGHRISPILNHLRGWSVVNYLDLKDSPKHWFLLDDDKPLHPWKLICNPKVTQLKRNIIFQTSILEFHVSFQGCNWNMDENGDS